MMASDASIFDQGKDTLCCTSQPPFKKCKYVNADTSNNAATEKISEQIKTSCAEFGVSRTWANYTVKIALRMAKIYVERSQMSSVRNSCHLVLQLEPHNIFAHYLKTVALQQLSHQKHKASRQWLQERGIDLNSLEMTLPGMMDEKQKEIREKRAERSTRNGQWWEISELCLLDLDVVSLNIISEHMQNPSKTS